MSEARGDRPPRARITEPAARLRMIETQAANFPLPSDPADPEFGRRWSFFATTYREAMQRYVRTLLRARLRRAPGEDEVEDLVSEFIRAAMDKGSLGWDESAPVQSFRRFLSWRLRNFVFDHLRRARGARRDPLARATPSNLDHLPDDESDPAALAALSEGIVKVAVGRALERLRAERAEALEADVIADLLATDGVGSADIAKRLGRDPAQMRTLRHRARQAFQGFLTREIRALCRSERDFWDLLEELDPFLP